MSAAQTHNREADLYRIVLFAGHGERLFVFPEKGRLRLPTLPVPRHRRIAENLTATLKSGWSQDAVCLFGGAPTSPPPGIRYQVMESWGSTPLPTDVAGWVSVSSLDECQFEDVADYEAVRQSLEQCQMYAASVKPGPFARLGWFSELVAWAGEAVARTGLNLKGTFAQLNASPTFSLVRLETDGPAVWFKAVGEPNLREYPVTLALAKSFPPFVPCVVAARADWNAWLSFEAQGYHPNANSPAETWMAVARNLAELQIASVGQGMHLIDAGCRDARVSALRKCVRPFLEVMAELMEQQGVEPPSRFSRSQLLELGAQLDELLEVFSRFNLPTTLGHLDFNPGNIVVERERCLFLDWAEACCGPSFLSLHYLLEHVSRLTTRDSSLAPQIRSAYLNTWSDFIDPAVASDAFDVSRALAVFAYAACATGWRDERRRPTEAPYLRSLTRRLKKECDELRCGNLRSPRTARIALGCATT